MLEPFIRPRALHFTSEPNPETEWFFNEPSIATREYDGILMRKGKKGWEFYTPLQVLGHTDANWENVYVQNSFFRQVLQSLQNKWQKRQSNFSLVQEFEDAESPFTEEYENGEYWLVKDDPWYLVPVDQAEQLSNINDLDLHKFDSPQDVFDALRDTLELLKDEIYGVIFTGPAGQRVRVRPQDFEYAE